MLVDHAAARPDAAIVYADCQWHGGRDDLESAPSIEGDVLSRMRQHIEQKQPVAVRGLMRRGAVEQAGPIRGDEFRGLSEVFVWLAKLLRWGPFVRVPQPLYHRLDHSENYHKQWFDWPDDRKRGSWTTLYTGLMEATMPVCRTPEERFFFHQLILDRVAVVRPGQSYHYLADTPQAGGGADAGVPSPPRRRRQPIAPGPACRAHRRAVRRGRPPARRQPTPETATEDRLGLRFDHGDHGRDRANHHPRDGYLGHVQVRRPRRANSASDNPNLVQGKCNLRFDGIQVGPVQELGEADVSGTGTPSHPAGSEGTVALTARTIPLGGSGPHTLDLFCQETDGDIDFHNLDITAQGSIG